RAELSKCRPDAQTAGATSMNLDALCDLIARTPLYLRLAILRQTLSTGPLGAVDANGVGHRSDASSRPSADGATTNSAWHRRWQDHRVFRVSIYKFSHHSSSVRLQAKLNARTGAAPLRCQANVFVGIADRSTNGRTDMFVRLGRLKWSCS